MHINYGDGSGATYWVIRGLQIDVVGLNMSLTMDGFADGPTFKSGGAPIVSAKQVSLVMDPSFAATAHNRVCNNIINTLQWAGATHVDTPE